MKEVDIGFGFKKPSKEQLEQWKQEDIKRLQHLINSTPKTTLGEIDKTIYEQELDAIKNGTDLDTNIISFNQDGFKVIHDELTTYGKAKKAKRMILKSGLEPILDRSRFDNFITKNKYQEVMKEKAQIFAKEPNGAFVLSGQSGVGKTHISTAICRYMMLHGRDVEYFVWTDRKEQIKSMDYNERNAEIRRINKHEVLYIDDFLKSDIRRGSSEADIELAFNLINDRYYRNKITIISTEFTYEEIQRMDVALAGRILEMGNNFGSMNFIPIEYNEDRNFRERSIKGE